MIVMVSFLDEYPDGNRIYQIDPHGEDIIEMSNLMRIRYHKTGIKSESFIISEILRLPKMWDIVEFDTKTKEWFISKYISKGGKIC